MPESTRMMQDGSCPDGIIELAEKRLLSWAATFSAA